MITRFRVVFDFTVPDATVSTQKGYAVKEMTGGFRAWKDEGRPVEK